MSKKMIIKIMTALVLVGICVPPLFLGGIYIKLLLLVIAVLASYEIASLVDHKTHWAASLLNLAAIIGICLVPDSHVAAVEAIWLIILFTIELLDEKITFMSIIGAVLITLGVIFANKQTEKTA